MLKKLNIRNATKLYWLCCKNNQLTELDLSTNEKLSTVYCENNRLEILTLGKKKKLTILVSSGNKIKKLDIRKSPVLQLLYETIPVKTRGVVSWIYISMETGPLVLSADNTTEIITGPITETIG